MPMSNDCTNTISTLGYNLTPEPIIRAAQAVLGTISRDFCSDEYANKTINALHYFNFCDDGYARLDHYAPIQSVWLNPPGKSFTGGSYCQRSKLQDILNGENSQSVEDFLTAHNATYPNNKITRISAADWYRAVFKRWQINDIKEVIWLLYRGGSFGSLGKDMLAASALCLTTAGCPGVNGSGRISFE